MFKRESKNWVVYRDLANLLEVDFHNGDSIGSIGSYHENMDAVYIRSLNALINAQKNGKEYVLFTHGSSTSRIGATTSRSQVRKLMRSKDATPYIIRKNSIQHPTVFVAAIKPLKLKAK